MQPEPTTLAYLAGVIDADGYITANRSRHSGRWYVGAAVSIGGTRREPHDLAASLFGGNVSTYYPRGDRAHHRPQFQWQRYGRSAVPVIQAVLPYLRIKVDQAHLVLDMQEAVDEAREMRSCDDPYPWFGPDYEPMPHLLAAADEVRELNIRRNRAAGYEPQAVTA